MVGDGEIDRRSILLQRLRLNHFHQGIQAVQAQRAGSVQGGTDLVDGFRRDGKNTALHVLNHGLGHLLNFLNGSFQHIAIPPYANLMIFRAAGASCSPPSKLV